MELIEINFKYYNKNDIYKLIKVIRTFKINDYIEIYS